MKRADHPEALAQAAAPALEALERDARRAPRRLRPLFAAMAELLFDPELDLDRIRAAAGCGEADVWLDLRAEVGRSAWSYLREARLETAARLLLETPLSISEIGRLVGYASPSTFRRPLRSFLGMPPSRYRRQAPRRLERAGAPPAGAGTDDYWLRVLDGGLDDREARELDRWLARLAPAGDASPPGDADRGARLHGSLAETLADTLEHLPWSDQRRLARDAVWFPDGTFFELLSDRARQADDPERGVELALLAIDSLAANHMLETHPGHASMAWARLLRARWRAGDAAAAERDLKRSIADDERLPEGSWDAPWTAERHLLVAAFHWHRGRPREALEIAGRAVGAERRGSAGGLARALVLRAGLRAAGADLGAGDGLPEEALWASLDDVEEALATVELAAGEPPQELPAAFALWLRLLVAIDDRGERAAVLPEVRQWASDLGEPAAPLLLWFEGHAAGRPGSSWQRAREGFLAAGDDLWGARATLDLARLHLADGQAEEVSRRVSELVTSLGARAEDPEDLAVLKSLGRPIAFGEVSGEDLDRAERVLQRLEWDEQAQRAFRFVE